MSLIAKHSPRHLPACGSAIVMLIAALLAGCSSTGGPPNPAVGLPPERAELLDDLRAYERTLGFAPTANFTALSKEQDAFPHCGVASPLILPYSYEDPAISWLDARTEQECRTRGGDADVYFVEVEARGEAATPLTPAMMSGRRERFIYLVIHEDCHDQFELPHGVEEALCNLITYQAMAAFSAGKYGHAASEHQDVQRYADTQSGNAHATIAHYERIAALYADFDRRQIVAEALLRARGDLLQAAAAQLGWKKGDVNNVRLANLMTYSRHFPALESVFDALGRDIARTVAFFRRVDAAKPARETILARYGIADENGAEALRVYEAAVMASISAALAAESPR